MGNKINEEFGPLGYPVTTKETAYCLLKFISFFNSDMKNILPSIGKDFTLVNNRSKEILGIDYRPSKESLYEMIYKMIEDGHIPDKRLQ